MPSDGFATVDVVDAEEESQEELLRNENSELLAELRVREAECIVNDMELTQVKSECEGLNTELARVKQLLAKSEHDRKRAIAKYNHLLDEMRSSPTEMEAKLAEYRRKADDFEDRIEKQRAAWQETGVFLKTQTVDAEAGNHTLREEITQLNTSLNDERKKIETLTVELENAQTESQEWERKAKDAELKLASTGKTHTAIQSLFRKQSVEQAKRAATAAQESDESSFENIEHVAGEVTTHIEIAA